MAGGEEVNPSHLTRVLDLILAAVRVLTDKSQAPGEDGSGAGGAATLEKRVAANEVASRGLW